jgi:nucleotide-binding universal stress UspA family protein
MSRVILRTRARLPQGQAHAARVHLLRFGTPSAPPLRMTHALPVTRILVALDASPSARRVLAAATALARPLGAKLRLFRAVPIQPEVPWDMIREFPNGGLEALLSQHARADMEARAREVPPELLDGIETKVEVPHRAIVDAARAFDADLVVVGSHGYDTIDRLIGTTAEKVVRHADRPVLVVR